MYEFSIISMQFRARVISQKTNNVTNLADDNPEISLIASNLN